MRPQETQVRLEADLAGRARRHACCRRARAGRRDREGDREIPRDAARKTPGAIRAISMSIAARRCGPRRPARSKATLEQCDLGKGPGKVEGAFAELPRYFADADRVMDVETRILWCMEKLQGISAADYVKRPHPGGGQPVKELGAMATYVASKSVGREIRRAADACEGARGGGARRDAVPSPLRPVRFRLRDLPCEFRPAHPPAGPALPRREEGGRAR